MIVGLVLGGLVVGFAAGALYGFHVDRGDLPLAPILYAPAGAAAGAVVGAIIAQAV